MALLFTSPISSLSSHSLSIAVPPANPLLRICNPSIVLHPKSYSGFKIQSPCVLNNRDALIVKASADIDGTGSTAPGSPTPAADSKEENVPVEKLPLESTLDQKMKMKMAKKIRLRRKRLVRKRHLRKKGRWPPSKLKKNKNV